MRFYLWPLTCLLLLAASVAAWLCMAWGWAAPQALIWHADGWQHEPWTLWTAALVHFLPAHGAANVLALLALGMLGAALAAPPRDALALLLAWPLGTLALTRWPQVASYHGFSEIIHAAAAVLAVRALLRPDVRWLGLLLAGGLAIKLSLERGWTMPVAFDPGWALNAVFAAHLTGAVCGAAAAALLNTLAWTRRRLAASH